MADILLEDAGLVVSKPSIARTSGEGLIPFWVSYTIGSVRILLKGSKTRKSFSLRELISSMPLNGWECDWCPESKRRRLTWVLRETNIFSFFTFREGWKSERTKSGSKIQRAIWEIKGDAATLPAFRISASFLPQATIQLQLQSRNQQHRQVNQSKSTTITTWNLLPAVDL